MASRSDQLHSHQFTLQRVVGALAMRDPDPVSSPMRRIGGALFASVMLAVLALAAVGVYGVLRPGGGDKWRDGTAMIIEKETGARYVYRNNVLYPVLNYSSALLILGASAPASVQVPRAALVGIPRGAPLGIPGAPDPLPGRDQLLTTPWTVCSRPPAAPAGTAASSGVESVLRVGSSLAADGLGDRGLLVSDPSGGLHLLWHDRRYALVQPTLVVAAFAWSKESATPVATALLNAIPAGADLRPLTVAHADKASAVPGLRVGEVFVVGNQSGLRRYGVALADGVADITPLQAGLLIADRANGGGDARELGQAAYGAVNHLPSLEPTGDAAPPPDTPTQAHPSAGGGVCATFTAGGATPTIGLAHTVRPIAGEFKVPRSTGDPGITADWVFVPAGRGAVVEAVASPAAPSGALALVTDLGLRYPVASTDVLGVLGYADATPQRFPAGLVALLPSGAALDPALAVLPARP